MCHAPAICFQVEKRGFIREGYYADLVLIDTNATSILTKESIYHKCQWSPLEGHRFMSQVTDTFINGRQVYSNGKFDESVMGKRLTFNR
jgi:dihydroorotase